MESAGQRKTLGNIALGASRRLARTIPYRPVHLRLDQPVVSFSFDDFPLSAYQNAAPILERAEMRGTFYYATGLAGKVENGQEIVAADQAAELHARGHEIGAHTDNHLDVHRTARAPLLADLQRNIDGIKDLTGGCAPGSFAYPYGRLDLRSKFILSNRFAGLRGIQPGINRGLLDLAHLRAQELYDCSSSVQSIAALLDRLADGGGWLIFYTHDVKPDPSTIGCSPAHFAATVAMVRERGLQVSTVSGVLKQILGGKGEAGQPAERAETML